MEDVLLGSMKFVELFIEMLLGYLVVLVLGHLDFLQWAERLGGLGKFGECIGSCLFELLHR